MSLGVIIIALIEKALGIWIRITKYTRDVPTHNKTGARTNKFLHLKWFPIIESNNITAYTLDLYCSATLNHCSI